MKCFFNRFVQFCISKISERDSKYYFPKWCKINSLVEGRKSRWVIGKNGEIIWNIDEDLDLPHYDHLEMSGFFISAILSYGVDKKKRLKINRHLAFPMLRVKPNNTRDNLRCNFGDESREKIKVNEKFVKYEYPHKIEIQYGLKIFSKTEEGIRIIRECIPSRNQGVLVEEIDIKNILDKEIKLKVEGGCSYEKKREARGVYGEYIIESGLYNQSGKEISSEGIECCLEREESIKFYRVYQGYKRGFKSESGFIKVKEERKKFIERLKKSLVLKTPDETINKAFDFAKVRVCESIFKTKRGLMHSPGGGSYYAAMWMNDQCEYVNPLFPFMGYPFGIEEGINCYKLFKEYIDKGHKKAPVTSIIAEGDKTWNLAGDRGDAAMYAYGAGRFCLALGNKEVAEELWEGIVDSLEYSLKRKNTEGVIMSSTDELEHRFSCGRANLFTSSLLVDALRSAAFLGEELCKGEKYTKRFNFEGDRLEKCIEEYFGAYIQGYETYRYHKLNRKLRGWICIPLAMGIMKRIDGTIKAIFSEKLWNGQGIRTEEGCEIFWDRTTLYGLKGAFMGGYADEALLKLSEYSKERLLGEHVPYPVESNPEGNQKHLSGESALYLRVFIEGVLGIRPISFDTFICNPHLPSNWNYVYLEKIMIFNKKIDIIVKRLEKEILFRVIRGGKIIYSFKGRGPFRVKMG